MKRSIVQRNLCFERMEDRLALSATMGVDFEVALTKLTVEEGGFISLSGNETFSYWSEVVPDQTFNRTDTPPAIVVRGEPFYFGEVGGTGDAVGNFEFEAPAAHVVPIPQPQTGPDNLQQGMVSVAEIFRPSTPELRTPSRTAIAEPFVEKTPVSAADTSWKSLAVARARDVYFEVAGREERELLDGDELEELAQEQLRRGKLDKPVANRDTDAEPTAAEPLNTSADAGPPREAEPTSDENLVQAEEEAVSGHKPASKAGDDLISSIENRGGGTLAGDRVLADWRRNEIDESTALETRQTEDDSAAWPVLTAVVGGGWLIKSRRRRSESRS